MLRPKSPNGDTNGDNYPDPGLQIVFVISCQDFEECWFTNMKLFTGSSACIFVAKICIILCWLLTRSYIVRFCSWSLFQWQETGNWLWRQVRRWCSTFIDERRVDESGWELVKVGESGSFSVDGCKWELVGVDEKGWELVRVDESHR